MIGFCKDMIADLSKRKYDVPKMWILDTASAFLVSIDDTALIESFITKSYSHWDRIKIHDEKFFVENSGVIFGDVPKETTKMFVDMFTLIFPKSSSMAFSYCFLISG